MINATIINHADLDVHIFDKNDRHSPFYLEDDTTNNDGSNNQ